MSGFTIVPMHIMSDKAISFYDRALYAVMMVSPGWTAAEIAEEYGLDEAQVKAGMTRWLERGDIEVTNGEWDFKPYRVQILD